MESGRAELLAEESERGRCMDGVSMSMTAGKNSGCFTGYTFSKSGLAEQQPDGYEVAGGSGQHPEVPEEVHVFAL